jgi:hypothetical protein
MRRGLKRVSAAARSPAVRVGLLTGLVSGCFLALLNGRRIWGPHLAFEAVAVACFAALLALERKDRWLTFRTVAMAGSVLLVLAVTFPPTESADVWSYVMYGRIVAVHHANPYTTPPAAYPDDRWSRLVRPIWRDSPSLYGPLFQSVAALVVRVVGGSGVRLRLGFQLIAALALVGILWLLWWRTRDPPAVAVLALNPLVIIGGVNGAHTDALVGLAVLSGVLLSEGRRKAVVAGVMVGLGALVKVVALLPAGILILWTWRRRGTRAALVNGAAVAATVAAGYALFGRMDAIRALGSESGLTNRFSVWRLVWWIHPVVQADGERHLASGAASWITMALLLALALLASVPALRLNGPDRAVALAVLVYLLGGLYVQPWYVIWALPTLALAWRSRLVWVAIGLEAALTVAYGLSLHKQLGPLGSTIRTGYFAVVSAAEALVVLTLVALGVLDLVRRRGASPSRRPGAGVPVSGEPGPGP